MVAKSRNLIQAQGLIQKNNLDAYTNVKKKRKANFQALF